MGFPDTFQFKGSKTDIARQIGNAVPPDFASVIGKMVAEFLDECAQLEAGVKRKRDAKKV
jgi:DNA (cytosine-5)-methyltransferase 1